MNRGIWSLHLLPLLPGDFTHLEYMHIRNLRRILGIYAALHSRVWSENILHLSGAPTLPSLIAKKKLSLLGHILRRDPTHPNRLLLFEPGDVNLRHRGLLDGVNRRGRPRTLWAETKMPKIERILNMTKPEILALAQSRENRFRETDRLLANSK